MSEKRLTRSEFLKAGSVFGTSFLLMTLGCNAALEKNGLTDDELKKLLGNVDSPSGRKNLAETIGRIASSQEADYQKMLPVADNEVMLVASSSNREPYRGSGVLLGSFFSREIGHYVTLVLTAQHVFLGEGFEMKSVDVFRPHSRKSTANTSMLAASSDEVTYFWAKDKDFGIVAVHDRIRAGHIPEEVKFSENPVGQVACLSYPTGAPSMKEGSYGKVPDWDTPPGLISVAEIGEELVFNKMKECGIGPGAFALTHGLFGPGSSGAGLITPGNEIAGVVSRISFTNFLGNPIPADMRGYAFGQIITRSDIERIMDSKTGVATYLKLIKEDKTPLTSAHFY